MRHKVVKVEIPKAWFFLNLWCVPHRREQPHHWQQNLFFFWFESNSFWRQQLCSGHEKEKICRNCHLQRWRLHHFRARAHTNLYIPSIIKTQMNLVTFYFWADWVARAFLKISANLLKYPILGGVLFHVFMSKMYANFFL